LKRLKFKYVRVLAGERIRQRMEGWKMACCDCGLVHLFKFKVVREGKRNAVEFVAHRDNRATAAVRRKRKAA
jgi:hypothetical protein